MLVLTTAAFSQNCVLALPTSSFSGPGADGKYTLTINYLGSGAKSFNRVIKCGTQIILDDCLATSGDGTSVLNGLSCPAGIGSLMAILTPHTGSICNGSACGPIVIVTGAAGGPLPVKLSSFSAIRSKQVVALNWNTEFEIDAKEFVLERAEGNEFRSVGTIKSSGNSSAKKSYSFNDKNENAGNTYYRLKNVDLNGRFTYSEIRTVKGIGSAPDVTVFPNPARSNSQISVVGAAANSSIQLLDFSGKVLKSMNNNSVNSMDLSGVKNGTYLIRIVDKTTNEVVNKKLTISN